MFQKAHAVRNMSDFFASQFEGCPAKKDLQVFESIF
jgi:hypothetical protein